MIFKLALFACHGVRNITSSFCHPGRSRRRLIGSMLFAIALSLTACGGDSSTSVNDDESSSSSVILDSVPGSASNSSKSDSGTSAGMTSSSTKKSSSSRMDLILSSGDSRISSSLQNDRKSSSSSVISDKKSSSSVIPGSVPGSASSSSKTDSGTSVGMTSSSEYVPFDHSKTLAAGWRIGGDDRYKQFTDPRNGRSYYYITITSVYSGDSVTVMAENLNIGEMVLGKNDQNDDAKIERYCYNNDTTLCDEFGGLYQWAEMMQLPSRCNTESCSDLIQENHRGICPEGWRLMTYDDFVVIEGYKDEFGYGIKGLRSAYGFAGNNYSGLSLTGAGLKTLKGEFADLKKGIYWYLPEEFEGKESTHAHSGLVSADDEYAPTRNNKATKTQGYSVRCVMVE